MLCHFIACYVLTQCSIFNEKRWELLASYVIDSNRFQQELRVITLGGGQHLHLGEISSSVVAYA